MRMKTGFLHTQNKLINLNRCLLYLCPFIFQQEVSNCSIVTQKAFENTTIELALEIFIFFLFIMIHQTIEKHFNISQLVFVF